MCGHVGFTRNVGNQEAAEFLLQGLWAGSLRGMDATGIAYGSLTAEKKLRGADIYKKSMHGADFISLRHTYEIMRDRPDWVIGHNRASTNGGTREMNAHPFREGHIILAHNGHINNQYTLPKTPPVGDTRIDSARVAFSMAYGDELTTLNALRGGYALVWMNMETGKLNFARNDAKPLYFAFEKNMNGMYWASELDMLDWLMFRNEIEIDGEILTPEPFNWYQFDPANLRGFTMVPFEKPSVQVVTASSTKTTKAWDGYEGTQIKMLGVKKQAKLLEHHGLKVGQMLCVSLKSIVTRNNETVATYDLCEKGLKKFKGAIQEGRPLDALRKQMEYANEDKLELGTLVGVSGDRGALWLVIASQMDETWKDLQESETPEIEGPNYEAHDMAPGPHNRLINLQKFLELTAEGCAVCGGVINSKSDIIWDEVATNQYIVFHRACGERQKKVG